VVNTRAEVGFILRNDDKYKGKFAFEGIHGEFDITNIKVNDQKQICKVDNKQSFPDLQHLQDTFDKKRDEAYNPNKKQEKISDDDRRIICGYSKKMNPREVDDNIVVPGKYPWFVAISKKINLNYTQYLCAGTVINENHILTTASCLHENGNNQCLMKNQLIVQISPFYLSTLNKPPRSSNDILEIENIQVHANFSQSTNANNLAIIKLKNLIPYNDYILPACYPMNNYNVITGQRGLVRII
jgi:hypothetical protein